MFIGTTVIDYNYWHWGYLFFLLALKARIMIIIIIIFINVLFYWLMYFPNAFSESYWWNYQKFCHMGGADGRLEKGNPSTDKLLYCGALPPVQSALR